MNKFCGTVGFVTTEETSPGVWTPNTDERGYVGDLIRHVDRYDTGNKVNSDISLNNQVSIVMDPYALENSQHIKFVNFLGHKWRVTSVEIQYPRLLLNLGSEYVVEEEEEDDKE